MRNHGTMQSAVIDNNTTKHVNSVLDAKDLGKFTPMSADDCLRDMPGVVVELADGALRLLSAVTPAGPDSS